MKKISILIIMILMLASLTYAASKIGDSAEIKITVISQEPDPVQPGQTVDLRFKIENLGGGGTDNLIIEILPEYPFSLYKGSAEKSLGSMQAYQHGEEGIIALYNLKVDEGAVEGTNYINIRYKFGETGEWRTVKDLEIRIRTQDLVVSVESIETEPELVSPGDEFDLKLTIRNNADSIIRDVKVKLDVSSTTVPVAPSSSLGEQQIPQINQNTAKIMDFRLIALPDSEGGVYKIPVNISYTDNTGTIFKKNDYISLKISSTPDLLVAIDKSEITKKVRQGTITVKIVNRGLTNLKLMSAKLEESKKYSVSSQEEVYVGNIDTDDYETIDYTISVSSYDKIIDLPIKLSYMDSTNKKFSQDYTLKLKTQSNGLILTIIGGIISFVIKAAIVIGIIYGAYWWYKRRKKNKKTL